MILFFNSNKAWGGGEKWHFEIAKRLQNIGYKVTVLAASNGELIKKCKKSHVNNKSVRISNLSFLNIFKLIYYILYFKRLKPTAILLNLPADLKLAGLAARIAGVPNIIYRRGSAIEIKNKWLNRFLFKYIITSVIANSFETRQTILKQNKKLIAFERIHVIHNGIDLYEFDHREFETLYQRRGNEILIGNAGRLDKQKGQQYLIDMAVLLKKQNIPYKVLIAGTGELEGALKQQAIKKGVAENIIFLGFVENIKSLMQSIDVFVLSSLWEGFGYVLIEAMASVKPIVAFDISSNPEIMGDEQFLVEPFDINHLVWCIQSLATDKILREKMGQLARERVETHFSIETTVRQVIDLVD